MIGTLAVAGLLARDSRAGDWLIDPSPFRASVVTNAADKEIALANGLMRRVFKLSPDATTVGIDNLMTGESELRSVRPEAQVELNGKTFDVGGLLGQPVHNYFKAGWLAQMKANPEAFHFTGYTTGLTEPRFPWQKHVEWLTAAAPWPPPGISLTLSFSAPAEFSGVTVDVHYEMYDGIPLVSKWIVLRNQSGKTVHLNSFKSEVLAVVENTPKAFAGEPREWHIAGSASTPPGNYTEVPRDFIARLMPLFVVSDYSMGGDMEAMKDNPGVRWLHDPVYKTGIRYYGEFKPCLLECAPAIGPDVDIADGTNWESYRVFELLQDSTEQERRGLAERKLWRTIAPWCQENPVLMHVRSAETNAVKLAIDQCAEVGFQMVIMTFGSGFNIENEKPEYLAQMKSLADYARSKGVALGGYSLLASRSIDAADDVINPKTGKPGGARFGDSPCLGSVWGENYFRKLKQFFEQTGCGVLENDGSYPGDVCASTNHPGHVGLNDSQWQQWKIISQFYQWCRGRGIYLNVPDWYFLNGSSKTAMGYVENNWSLPRDEQEIIERQNIFDGTWEKTPTMGWMFVPLTQYHGGGAAATIEPLKDHLPHYETRLANLFGAGVQACYRGPRLYDTDETKAIVKKWVDFYNAHRPILDSDIIHLRRPDGQDWDGWLHVNPGLAERGLAMIYNPLDEPIQRRIRLPLYYTGLTDKAEIRHEDGRTESLTLARDYSVETTVNVPARGRVWIIIDNPKAGGPAEKK